jgi:hypothetical protein
MSNEEKFAIAKEYVDKQLNVMKNFNAAPKAISEAEYKSLIESVAETIKPQSKKTEAESR